MPPAPTSLTISYCPRQSPGASWASGPGGATTMEPAAVVSGVCGSRLPTDFHHTRRRDASLPPFMDGTASQALAALAAHTRERTPRVRVVGCESAFVAAAIAAAAEAVP